MSSGRTGDSEGQQLWHGEKIVALEPQLIAVLPYLVEHAGGVVSKEELLREVWAGQFVVKAMVKECIRAIRKALDDDVAKPQYIETAGREGYRFLAPHHASTPPVSGSRFLVAEEAPEQRETRNEQSETCVVGCDTRLTRLHEALCKALNGERQLVFVTDEPGIRKTTVVN